MKAGKYKTQKKKVTETSPTPSIIFINVNGLNSYKKQAQTEFLKNNVAFFLMQLKDIHLTRTKKTKNKCTEHKTHEANTSQLH